MFEKYDAYKDSGVDWIGDIPADWDTLKLKNVAYINPTNTVLSNSLDKNTQVCFLAMENVEADGTVNYQNKRRLASVKSGFTNFIKNDVLVAKITPCFENGKGALLDQLDSEIGFGSTEFHVLRSKHNSHPKFLYYVTKSHNFMDFGEGMMIGSAGQKRVPTDFIENFSLALPNKTLQSEIAKFLDAKTSQIEQVIAIKEQQIALLNERKQIVIQKAVTQGLDPNVAMKDSCVEWIGQIPEHWEVIRSKFLFTQRKENSKKDDVQLSATQAYGVIPQEEYEKRTGKSVVKISLHLDKRKRVYLNDFVISMRSFQGGLERAWAEGCIRSSYVVLKPLKPIDPDYYGHLFKTPMYIKALQNTSNFIRDGQDLNFGNFSQVDLFIVPLSEQKQIVEYIKSQLGDFEKHLELLNQQIEKLKEYKTTLINDAVTGKIKVA